MTKYYTRANAVSATTGGDLFIPFVNTDTATASIGDNYNLVTPIGGELSFTVIMKALPGNDPGDVVLTLIRNNGAALDTDSAAAVGSSAVTFNLSAAGWTAGDYINLQYSQTLSGGGLAFYIEWSD